MHGGATQLLVGRLLAGRHLDQRGPAEEHLGALLDHDDVVAHAGDVGAAGGGVAEDKCHSGKRGGRLPGEVPECPPSRNEQLGLGGEVGSARLHQIDGGKAVGQGDIRTPGTFFEGERVHGTTSDGGIVGRDETLDSLHHPDPGDRRGTHRELTAPPCQWAELQKGGVPIEEEFDPFAGGQLAPLPMPGHVPLATAGPGGGQLLVDQGHGRLQGGPIGPVGVRGHIDGGGEGGHGVYLGCMPVLRVCAAYTRRTWEE